MLFNLPYTILINHAVIQLLVADLLKL